MISVMTKKKLSLFSIILLLVSVPVTASSCGKSKTPLTMYVGLGNVNVGYYEFIQEQVEKELGIYLELVYTHTNDTTNSMVEMIENDDLPADIVITASKTDNDKCKNSLMDLATYTDIAGKFNSSEIEKLSGEDGESYQLPFTSRLIGIEYNKTLMEEMGWEPPQTYQDMLELKAKADAAGIKFAVAGGAATGHGFNYLFNLMGTQFLITPDGEQWLTDYRKGETNSEAFSAAASYFQKYADAGLFGTMYDAGWDSNREFARTRALFYYNILNDIYSYDGYQYNSDGTIKGASYGADGKPVAKKDKKGEAVLINGEYELYDKNNTAHKGLDRYTIPGAVILHDEYASIPWISEDGSMNCYVAYNNMYVGLSNDLLEEENSDRFEDAKAVLEYMLSDKAAEYFSSVYQDGYYASEGYSIDETRLYYEYADEINKGFIMSWYYNEFDVDTIVNVGGLVNSYLKGDAGVGMSKVISVLDSNNQAYIKHEPEIVASLDRSLDFKESAELQCIANGMAAEAALKTAGIKSKVQVALLPYETSFADINQEIDLPVVQAKMYAGDIEKSLLASNVNGLTNDVAIVKMSGKDINNLVKKGYDTSELFGYEHVFEVACKCKGDISVRDKKDYYVAIPWQLLGEAKLEEYKKDGKVILAGGEPLKTNTLEGFDLFFKNNKKLSADDLNWK